MILFKKIKWRNLLSTGNYWSEIVLNKSQNTLIVGKNGSGKSTLLDALCFVLFGKAYRNINKPNLVNSINQKECLVELEFSTNNKEYRIVRGIKPNVFEIYCDGALLNQDAATKDYQDYLEKFIVKLNFKSFTQIVILGSASFVPFMQLSAADRRSIIEDLLDIQIFSSMNSVLKEKTSINKESISENKHEYELVSKTYELQEKHITNLRSDNEQKIEQHQKEIEVCEKQIKNLFDEVEIISAKVKTLNENIQNKNEIDKKIKKITQLEAQIESNISKFKKDISFFEKNDDCPTCKQHIDSNFKEEEMTSLRIKIDDSNRGLKQLEFKLFEEQTRLANVHEKIQKIQEHQLEIATKNTSITETNKYMLKLQKEIASLANTKENLENEVEKLKVIREQLNLLEKTKHDLIEEKTYLETASLLLKDSGIKTKIIKQYLPIINKLVNKHLSSMEFFVNFNLDDSFKETIRSRHRDEFSYNNFSEGEKQRIDMALMLTWRAVAKLKNSANTNLLILDEVFDSSLDSNGTEYLMNLLHMLEDVNLFVISHKGDILQDKFGSTIKFDKFKEFSRIVQ